jgi:hypothetical protein
LRTPSSDQGLSDWPRVWQRKLRLRLIRKLRLRLISVPPKVLGELRQSFSYAQDVGPGVAMPVGSKYSSGALIELKQAAKTLVTVDAV